MLIELLVPIEVDGLLRYRPGKSERLAKRGDLPHVRLPDGSIRFRREDIMGLLHTDEARTMRSEGADR